MMLNRVQLEVVRNTLFCLFAIDFSGQLLPTATELNANITGTTKRLALNNKTKEDSLSIKSL